MNFHKYQRSRSSTDLGPRSLRFSSFKIFSKTAWLTETKLYIESQWGWEIKICSWDLGHMTKIAAMLLYSIKDLEIFISGTERLMTLKLSMQH